MVSNTISSIEGENIILYNTDNTASTKFNMPHAETLTEEIC
jgi:hypothetical protein